MGKFFKAFFLTLLLILILGGGFVAFVLFSGQSQNPQEFLEELKAPNEKITFLLLGVDALDYKNNETRSDTIMIVNMDLDTGKANLVSVPRDTYAKIDGHGHQKINHSYNFGGPELTLKTVNNLLGTDIKNYVVMDYKFVSKMVDIVGGVEVDVPMDMKYEDTWANPPLKIDLKKGNQTLNGDQSIQFLRFRKGYTDQDLSRVGAQQQFVSAFLQKLKSPATFVKAPLMMGAYTKYTKSNIEASKIAKIGINVRKFNADSINATTLPGVPNYKNKISYFFVNEKKAATLLKEMGIK